MKKSLTSILAAVFCFGFALGDVSSVFAGAESEFTLEEITVTAQKREENQQKVAITMDTISGYELTERGAVNLSDILSNISFATVQQSGDNALNVTIRGLDSDTPSGGVASMVSVTVDGVYSNALGMGQSGIYDMERVEVLAGPQGTLYSRNSSGGVVNMVSKNPSDEFDASGTIEYGNYSLLNTQAALNTPINEKWSMRTAFSSIERDGYLSNGTDDNEAKSARIKLKYAPNNKISVLFSVETTKTGGKGRGSGVEEFGTEQPDEPWTATVEDATYYSNSKDTKRYKLNIEADVEVGNLTFIPFYTTTDVDQTSPSTDSDTGEILGKAVDVSEENEKSAELRLSSYADSRIEWIGGLYYYARKVEQFGDSPASQTHRMTDVDSEAAFANMTYPVSDRFRVTVGGRYTRDDGTSMSELITTTGYDLRDDENPGTNFDYKVATEYDLSENAMLWADFSTGYRQGMGTYDPEYVDAYQVGYKSRLLDQRLQFNASSFYYDYTNFTVDKSEWIIDETTGIEIMDRGAANAKAKMYGIDLQGDYVLTSRDRINLSASYLHTEIGSCVIKFETKPDDTSYEGGIMNNAPKLTLSGSYEHCFTLANGGDITAKIDSRYETEKQVAFDAEETDENTNPAHHVSNVSLTYNAPYDKWNFTGYVKNIENFAEKQQGGGTSNILLGAPRTYGVILSIRY